MIAKKYVKPTTPERFDDDGRPWFEVLADEIYPVAIAQITDLVAHPENRDGSESERHYLQLASRLPAEAWINAQREYGPAGLTPEQAIDRATALEIARKYFTAKLREECGQAMGLRIVTENKGKWKLGVQVEV